MSSAAENEPGPPRIDSSEEDSVESSHASLEEEGEEVRVRETVHVGSSCGRDVSVRTIESFNPDGSWSVVTATTDAVTRNVTVEAIKYPAPMGDSVGEAVFSSPETLETSASPSEEPGDICIGVSTGGKTHSKVPYLNSYEEKIDDTPETVPPNEPLPPKDSFTKKNRHSKVPYPHFYEEKISDAPETVPPNEPLPPKDSFTRNFRGKIWRRSKPNVIRDSASASERPQEQPQPSTFQRSRPGAFHTRNATNGESQDSSDTNLNAGTESEEEVGNGAPATDGDGQFDFTVPSAILVSDANVKLVENQWFNVIIFGRKIKIVYLASLLLIVTGIAICLSITLTGEVKEKEMPSSVMVPTETPTTPLTNENYKDVLEILIPISGMDVFRNKASIQSKALAWLIEDDEAYSSLLSDNSLIQRYVLLILYLCTSGGAWSSQLNFMTASVHECNWNAVVGRYNKGAFCEASNQTVTRIDLAGNNLQGRIPKEISELHYLAFLSLSRNALGSRIPTTLGELKKLVQLDLSGNSLTGTIPAIGNLSFLERLNLENNNLNGTVPLDLANLTSLVYLNARGNNISGSIDFLCPAGALIDIGCNVECSCCPSCPSGDGCAVDKHNVRLELHTDAWGAESTWDLIDARNSSLLFTGGPYGSNIDGIGMAYSYSFCLDSEENYTLTFYDSHGDGMNCDDSACGYRIFANGKFLASASNFGTSISFTIETTVGSIYLSEMCYADDYESSGCSSGKINGALTLMTDNFGNETGMIISIPSGALQVGALPPLLPSNTKREWKQCFPYPDTYDFLIFDTGGNGICCEAGLGFYDISINGNVLLSGGDFYLLQAASVTASKKGNNTCASVNHDATNGWDKVPESGCVVNEFVFILEIFTDRYGSETSWVVTNQTDNSTLLGGNTGSTFGSYKPYVYRACLPSPGVYSFTIGDARGNGMCCDYGPGGYSIIVEGSSFRGGSFERAESLILNATGSGDDMSVLIYPNEGLVPDDGCMSNEFVFRLEMVTDRYGSETSWNVANESDKSVLLEASDFDSFTPYFFQSCLPSPGIYSFTIYDSWGDGMCCSVGLGGYLVNVNESSFSGGKFNKTESLMINATGRGENLSVFIIPIG